MPLFEGRKKRASREAYGWLARLRGEPGAGERERFEHWYRSDEAHSEAYDRIAGDWRAAYGRVAKTGPGRARVGLPTARASRSLGYALAAATLIASFGGGLLLIRPGTESAARAEIFATAVGEIRTVELSDRSRVTLDTGSRVAVRYQPQERRIELLEGRARFYARPDADRPFVVETEVGDVVAGEGSFDLGLGPAGATLALIAGEAEVRPPAGHAPERGTVRVLAGERVRVAAEGRAERMEPVSEAELKWPSGMLEFRGLPLAQAAAEANRYSGTKIAVEPSVAGLRVTGTFRAGDTEGLADSLAAAFGLRVDRSGGTLLLRPAR